MFVIAFVSSLFSASCVPILAYPCPIHIRNCLCFFIVLRIMCSNPCLSHVSIFVCRLPLVRLCVCFFIVLCIMCYNPCLSDVRCMLRLVCDTWIAPIHSFKFDYMLCASYPMLLSSMRMSRNSPLSPSDYIFFHV